MSQDSHSPKTHMLDTSSTQNITQSKTPRSKWVRFIGIGCLVTVLCIGVGVATILFSGVLKGPKGNQDETPAWSPDGSQIAFVSSSEYLV